MKYHKTKTYIIIFYLSAYKDIFNQICSKIDKIYTHFSDQMRTGKTCMCKYIPMILNRLEALENVARYEGRQNKCTTPCENKITSESLLLREKELNQRFEKSQQEKESLQAIAKKLTEELQMFDQLQNQHLEDGPANDQEVQELTQKKETILKLISTVNKFFGTMYQQIKDTFQLPDLNQEDQLFMVRGIENIVNSVVKKINTLGTMMQQMNIMEQEQQ